VTEPGPGVDAAGNPVIDPTKNVLDLVRAAIQRQDDLRGAESRHLREVIELRGEIARIREAHAQELRRAEADRLDAIRSVDVGAVSRAAEEQDRRATALATQVATVADTFRTALATELALIRNDIAELREARRESGGRSAGLSQGWTLLIGAMGLVLTVVVIISIVIGTR
jgi:hypothetical protein